MVSTNKFVKSLTAYVPGESIEHAKELYGDIEIIKMASNENPLGASPKAVEAMRNSEDKINFYPDTTCAKLKKALSKYYDISENNLIVTSGSSGSLYTLAQSYLDRGDEILFCTPTYPTYTMLATIQGATAVTIPMDESYTYDLEKMKNAITDKTKVIMLCNPNNPTGTMVSSENIENFVKEIRNDILVIIDEAYIHFSSAEDKSASINLVRKYDNIAVLRTFSKVYGLAGARIGVCISSEDIINTIYKVEPFAAVSRSALDGAYAALFDQEFVEKTIKMNNNGKKYLMEEFVKLGFDVVPTETNFIYMDVHTDGTKLFEDLKPLGLVIRPQHDSIVRITIGTEYQNKKLIEGIKKVLKG